MAQAATTEKVKENKSSPKNAQTAEFPEASDTNIKGSGGSIDILLDMDVPVTVTIGQKSMTVRKLLQLAPGSVVKLDKPLEEPVDLYLSGSKFATGSVVVVDGCFAVKIKQIIGLEDSQQENN